MVSIGRMFPRRNYAYVRWYEVRRFQNKVNKSSETENMLIIIMLLIRKLITELFEETVAHNFFNE